MPGRPRWASRPITTATTPDEVAACRAKGRPRPRGASRSPPRPPLARCHRYRGWNWKMPQPPSAATKGKQQEASQPPPPSCREGPPLLALQDSWRASPKSVQGSGGLLLPPLFSSSLNQIQCPKNENSSDPYPQIGVRGEGLMASRGVLKESGSARRLGLGVNRRPGKGQGGRWLTSGAARTNAHGKMSCITCSGSPDGWSYGLARRSSCIHDHFPVEKWAGPFGH